MRACARRIRSRRIPGLGINLSAGLASAWPHKHSTERILTMMTADTKPNAAGPHLMELRLDALDRALLGILPRSERLALVTQVETRVRELTDSNPAIASSSEIAMESEINAGAVSRRAPSGSPKRRSRLALSSGILGIVALVMLFAMPITYVLVSMIGEDLGEFVVISLLSIHVLVVAVGGLVALVMGIAGLVSLSRRKGLLVGHGWAITGLCAAPLPTLVGGLLVLVTSLSLVAVQSVSVEPSSSPPQVVLSSSYSPSPAASSGSSAGAYCPSIPAMPASFSVPLPLSAAPTFCAPPDQGPQLCPAPGSEPSTAGYQPAELTSTRYPIAPAGPGSLPAPQPPALPPAPPRP